jgi:hypothetical protein
VLCPWAMAPGKLNPLFLHHSPLQDRSSHSSHRGCPHQVIFTRLPMHACPYESTYHIRTTLWLIVSCFSPSFSFTPLELGRLIWSRGTVYTINSRSRVVRAALEQAPLTMRPHLNFCRPHNGCNARGSHDVSEILPWQLSPFRVISFPGPGRIRGRFYL